MRRFYCGFAGGTVLLQCCPQLYSRSGVVWFCCCGFVLLAGLGWWLRSREGFWVRCGKMGLPLALGCLLGFALAHERAVQRLAQELAPQLQGRDQELVGIIQDLPQNTPQGIHFLLHPLQALPRLPALLALTWRPLAGSGQGTPGGEINLIPGQCWQLTVRLRVPHSQINPGGFDLEAWDLAQGIGASGWVRTTPVPCGAQLLGTLGLWPDPGVWIDQARERVRARIQRVLSGKPWSGVLVALVVGDQSGVAAEAWPLFWRTGVGHLISISGVHVTLLSALLARGVAWVWPSLRVRWLTTLGGAWLYALLAGFSVPTQRTLYMILAASFMRLGARTTPAGAGLLFALFAALLYDPWAPLEVGFWLSFGAVAGLMYASTGRVGWQEGNWRATLHTQWAASWVLIPLLIALFGQVSVLAPLANAVAIPLVTLGVLPLAFLGLIPGLGWALELSQQLFAGLADYLQWLALGPLATWEFPWPGFPLLILGGVGLLAMLAPRGWPGRGAGCLGLLALMTCKAPRPENGDLWLEMLDVGPGQMVIVQTQDHTLVFESGFRPSVAQRNFERVLVPALRRLGVRQLDGAILSVLQDFPPHLPGFALPGPAPSGIDLAQLPQVGSIPEGTTVPRQCQEGRHWSWDEVDFELLRFTEPADSAVLRPTAQSGTTHCVLVVTSRGQRVMLAGEIDQAGEHRLLERDPAALGATILLVPRHGSARASSADFVAAVHPRWAVFSAGSGSQARAQPAAEVLRRYRRQGAQLLNIAHTGALAIRLGKSQLEIRGERTWFPHYWWRH